MRHKKRLKERWVLGEYLIEMAELLKSGTSLGEALELTAGGVADGAVQVAFLQVADSVAAGGELAAALKAAFPGLPAFCVEMLGQAQREGDLPRVLLELGGYMEDMQSLRLYDASIAKTFVYPIAVSLIGMIVIGILMIFVIPQFQDMFANFGAELPAITVGVMKVSELFVDYWWMLLLAAILLSVVWKLLYPLSPGLRRLPGAIISRIPIFGGLYRLIVEGQLARTLGFVAASDAPLKQGLEAAGESLSSAYAREEILQVRGRMDTGSSLADVLAGHPLFSRKLVAVARVAERQGLVESLFLHVAKRNRRKLADAPNIEKVLEPLFMTLMGIIIGILVIAMYLPIFRLGAVV